MSNPRISICRRRGQSRSDDARHSRISGCATSSRLGPRVAGRSCWQAPDHLRWSVRYRERVCRSSLTGKEYGWARRVIGRRRARSCRRQAVIAESFERIHRSNLVSMGVLPLEFRPRRMRRRSDHRPRDLRHPWNGDHAETTRRSHRTRHLRRWRIQDITATADRHAGTGCVPQRRGLPHVVRQLVKT